MIDLFIRSLDAAEYMHPRVTVVRVQDYDAAAAVAAAIPASTTDVPFVDARPARTRASIAKLVQRRDAALDKEISEILKAKGAKPRAVSGGR